MRKRVLTALLALIFPVSFGILVVRNAIHTSKAFVQFHRAVQQGIKWMVTGLPYCVLRVYEEDLGSHKKGDVQVLLENIYPESARLITDALNKVNQTTSYHYEMTPDETEMNRVWEGK